MVTKSSLTDETGNGTTKQRGSSSDVRELGRRAVKIRRSRDQRLRRWACADRYPTVWIFAGFLNGVRPLSWSRVISTRRTRMREPRVPEEEIYGAATCREKGRGFAEARRSFRSCDGGDGSIWLSIIRLYLVVDGDSTLTYGFRKEKKIIDLLHAGDRKIFVGQHLTHAVETFARKGLSHTRLELIDRTAHAAESRLWSTSIAADVGREPCFIEKKIYNDFVQKI